jgi:hypothetical protein
MVVVKETEKAVLLEKDAVPFWVQKRWVKTDGSLTAAGNKAYWIAARKHWSHWDFNALKTFSLVQETDKAVLLRCDVDLPHEGRTVAADFWIPRSMVNNYQFVSGKIKEVENRFPFVGTKVKW